MKKIFSRALCLLLVLVMIVGIMPMAMADDVNPSDPPITEEDEFITPPTVTLSVVGGTSTFKVGDDVNVLLTATNIPEGYALTSIVGNPAANYTMQGPTMATATYQAYEGTWNLSATATFTSTAEGAEPITVTSSVVTVVVKGNEVMATAIAIEGAATVPATSTVTLKAVATAPAGEDVILPDDLVWTSNAPATVAEITSQNGATCTVKGKTITTNPVTITVTSASTGLSATHLLSVGKVQIDLNLEKSVFTLAPNQSEQINGTFTPTGLSVGKYVTVSYDAKRDANNRQIVTVNSGGLITAVAAGTTTVEIVMTLNRKVDGYENYVFANGQTTYSKTVTVTVRDEQYIKCANTSVAVGTSATLTPVLYGSDGKAVSGVTFTATITGYGNITPNGTAASSFTVASNTSGVAVVTFTAVGQYNNGSVPITKTVYVGFYKSNTLKVNVRDGLSSFKFNDTSFAQSATTGYNQTLTTIGYDMEDLIGIALSGVNQGNFYEFSISSAASGELTPPTSGDWTSSTKEVAAAQLGAVGFVQKSTTNKTTTFSITVRNGSSTNENAVTVGMLTVEVNCGASSGIEYKTTYNKAVNFSAADFQSHWISQMGSSSTLSYVVFGVGTYVPSYGKLYTDSTKTTQVSSTMYFAPTATSTYKSLSAVTYVPDATKTTSYSVEIPFTMYGTGSKSVSGYVTIVLNDGGNTIDARGTTLGESVASSIATNYYAQKNDYMSYVIFDAVSAQQATLYRSIPKSGGNSRVALATPVTLTDAFYYNAAGTYTAAQNKLSDVSLVPAAGYTGTVTVYYTAYNSAGKLPLSGSITYTVKAKTASAAFTDMKNYSWAIDSADFLYYEGTAQGSNGRYNPSANITRRDFMLMLYRAFLETEYASTTITDNFPDVVKGTDSYSQEIYQAVGVAKKLGIAKGTNGKFNPTAYITREEAVALIYRTLSEVNRTLRYTSSASATSFSDYSKVGSWASDAVKSMVSHGVLVGSNNKLSPKANITRAEMACILHRVITY